MEKISLSKNAYLVIFLEKLLLLLVSIIILIVILNVPNKISILKKYKNITQIIGNIGITCVILITLYTIIYPLIAIKKTTLTIYEDYIEYSEGFIFNKKTYLPIVNLMQIETTTNTIANLLNSSSLVFATSFLTIKTKPFDQDTAKKIVYYLIKQKDYQDEN